jgi:multiple sugar transport system substrate-binding protein
MRTISPATSRRRLVSALRSPRQNSLLAGTAAALLGAGLVAGCGSSSQQAAGGVVTIEFATQGLGAEETATNAAIHGFERANPKIKVKDFILSSNTTDALQQLTQQFVAGSGTPDVIESDVVYPASYAQSGWILPLNRFHPDMSNFFPGQVATVTYHGQYYGMPWFINAQGVFYRTDLVPRPPTTPQQLITDAKQAMRKDHKLKEGLAFEGDKYEGVICNYIDFLGGFGGSLNAADLDTPANVKALQFMQDSIYKYKIAPAAVTGWQESNVQNAFLSGQAAFAFNWPYIFPLADAKGSAVAGKVAWIPFPSSAGHPQSSLGGDDLVINAKSTHLAADWKFVQYMDSAKVQIARAVAAGDAPALRSAWAGTLFTKVPYFREAEKVFAVAAPRPVSPNYPKISADLQTMLSAVLSDQESAQKALSSTAPTVKSLFEAQGS